MAPEQLEGRDADARTDIFAFGALVHEMFTGRKAFEGKSSAGLIAAILEHDPASVSSIQRLASPALDRLVRTCLDKNPDNRWQSAADLLRELKWIAEGPTSTERAVSPSRTGWLRNPALAWGAAVVCAIGRSHDWRDVDRSGPTPSTAVQPMVRSSVVAAGRRASGDRWLPGLVALTTRNAYGVHRSARRRPSSVPSAAGLVRHQSHCQALRAR